jgi:hypothetical protein
MGLFIVAYHLLAVLANNGLLLLMHIFVIRPLFLFAPLFMVLLMRTLGYYSMEMDGLFIDYYYHLFWRLLLRIILIFWG